MSRKLKYSLLIAGAFLIFSISLLIQKDNTKKNVLSENSTSSTTPSPSPIQRLGKLYKVLKVVDGDTIDVDVNGKSQAVRLIGIDTPEVVDPRKPVQCFGIAASQKAKETLTGKVVFLESDPSQGDLDKYRRILRYVILEDGTNYNLMMISLGFAHEYTYNLPYKYQKEFKAAEKTAMQKELGLWNPNTCGGDTSSLNNSTSQIIQETSVSPAQTISSEYKPTGTYVCSCSKLCGQITSCDEAYYQLQNCGCSARDSDGDGVPCEALCQQ